MVHQIESSDFSPLGLKPKSWSIVKLKEITSKIGSGATPKGGEKAYLRTRHNYALIRSQNVFDRRFDEDGLAFISDAQAIELKNVVVQPGDLLLNITGDGITFARACLAPTHILPACVNQHVTIIRSNPDLCLPEYLLAYLTHPDIKAYIESFNAGGSRRAITKGHIESFVIPLPSLEEQRAIAGILSTLDAKIEVDRRMNATLESMARAVFRQWFVENEEVGDWKVGKVGDIAEVTDCLHSKKPERQEIGKPFLQLSNILDNGLLDMTDTYYISESDYDFWISRIEASLGDCVITNVGRVGAVAQVPEGVKAALGRNMTAVRLKKEFPYPTFLIECLLSDSMRQEINNKTDSGTILNALNVKNIPLLQLPLPPHNLLKEFEKIARPIRAKMEHNLKESRTLAILRDSLLLRLMKGEVRVKDVEV
jgi:type I restriction enzyme S subunit